MRDPPGDYRGSVTNAILPIPAFCAAASNSGHTFIACSAIGTQVQFRLATAEQCCRKISATHCGAGRPIDENLAVTIDGDRDDLRLFVKLCRLHLRQVNRNRLVEERRGDDEDDQQHEHHVNQRRGVDLGHRLRLAAAVEGTEGHVRLTSGLRHTGGSEINQLVTRPAAQPGDQEGMKIVRETIQAGERTSRLLRVKALYASTAGMATNSPQRS